MRKLYSVLFTLVLISGVVIAQDATRDEALTHSDGVSNFVPAGGEPIWTPEGAVIYDQSELVNSPGGGFGGADRSYIEAALGHTLFGWGNQVTANNSMADDFVIPAGEEWTLDQLITFAYQTGSTTTSSITEVRIRIWNGAPNGGGSIIFGDLTTNKMVSTTWSNIYRTTEAAPNAVDRPIMVQTSTIGTSLTAGTYWIEWITNGTLASGPWCPPRTILGMAVTGNALQNQNGTWVAALNGTSPNGAPFVLTGSIVPVELTSFAASVTGKYVNLTWTTASELNNQGFEVQRNISGEWEAITFVNGHGTTTEGQSYSYSDDISRIHSDRISYRLKQIDFDGTFEYSYIVEVEGIVPGVYSLEQNYPNPFNPSTSIQYLMPENGFVTIKVYDMLGNEIATLVNEAMEAGIHTVNFNASTVSSGIFFYTMRTGNFTQTKKMTLLK